MNIYLISTTNFGWDEYSGFIVIASNEDECRKLAAKEATVQKDTFLYHASITILGVYTGTKKRPFIALESFKAG